MATPVTRDQFVLIQDGITHVPTGAAFTPHPGSPLSGNLHLGQLGSRLHVVLIGKIVMLYSYIDFNLRRMIEVLDHAKALPPAWSGKTAKMHLSDVETILETAPDIAPNNALAFRRVKEFRKLRNLLAHFAVKRFPAEDALVFVTKSAADYKRVLGAEPDPGVVMTSVADLSQIRDVCRMIEEIQHWLSAATNDLENAFLETSKTGAAR